MTKARADRRDRGIGHGYRRLIGVSATAGRPGGPVICCPVRSASPTDRSCGSFGVVGGGAALEQTHEVDRLAFSLLQEWPRRTLTRNAPPKARSARTRNDSAVPAVKAGSGLTIRSTPSGAPHTSIGSACRVTAIERPSATRCSVPTLTGTPRRPRIES